VGFVLHYPVSPCWRFVATDRISLVVQCITSSEEGGDTTAVNTHNMYLEARTPAPQVISASDEDDADDKDREEDRDSKDTKHSEFSDGDASDA
jgi:hypothetical protein